MTFGGYDVEGIDALRQVNITGGNVNIKSKSAAILVDGIANATDYPDGVIISGGNVSLSTQSPSLPAVYVGSYQTKNIIVDGGNITLGGCYGLYTKNGVIRVNHFDSLNADNVENEVFRVSADFDTNEIIIANADYSEVDKAIARANSLNEDDYKDFSGVRTAIDAVVRGKNVLEQSKVDAMADEINNAIDSLELKNKDTSEMETNPSTRDNVLLYVAIAGVSLVATLGTIITLKKINE